jgi:gamma-glutamylcyclotransferase
VIRYFAYGSNLMAQRMRERGADFISAQPASLRDYRLTFGKRARDGSGRANVIRSSGGRVHGVLYEIASDALESLKQFQSGYDLVDIIVESVRLDGRREAVPAKTFMARSDRATDAPPSKSYLALILQGLDDHGLPEEAREEVRRAAGRGAATA